MTLINNTYTKLPNIHNLESLINNSYYSETSTIMLTKHVSRVKTLA